MAITGKSSSSSSSGVVLAAAAALLLLLLLAITTLAADDENACGVNIPDVATDCKDYVWKGSEQQDPSPPCCKDIEGADVGCACKKLLTAEVQSLLDMNHVVYVGRKCGLSIPKGTKCGDFVVNN
ncbi:unnamed protein product [Linum tenue]|uniref:Bifunctional inhibitor/plant lipid transfer protein/seed storage helical domain-containing protein n=1 Tax=Linum tenue TaxID=586396 RepID=A0AAV0JUZ4_9ROSI|nr:unnamed protein product [Linum tenue]